MKRQVEMSLMSWTDVHEVFQSDPVIFLPVGALEQHGPHLPLSTDSIIPTRVAIDAARRIGGLVAPTIAYGYKSIPRCGGGQHFCGTTSLDASTLIQQLRDVGRELVRHGAKRLAFVVGHMENQWFVTEACDLILRDARMLGLEQPTIMNVGYWEFLSPGTIAKAFDGSFPDWSLEHAGIMETSVMLHCCPELVHMERLKPQGPAVLPVYDVWPYDPKSVPSTGILNTAIGATAAKGKLFYDEFVESLADAATKALRRTK
jgi:creatinine amidohydrolase